MSERLYVREGEGRYPYASNEDIMAQPCVQMALDAARGSALDDIEKMLLAKVDDAYTRADRAEADKRVADEQFLMSLGSFYLRVARMVARRKESTPS